MDPRNSTNLKQDKHKHTPRNTIAKVLKTVAEEKIKQRPEEKRHTEESGTDDKSRLIRNRRKRTPAQGPPRVFSAIENRIHPVKRFQGSEGVIRGGLLCARWDSNSTRGKIRLGFLTNEHWNLER